MENKIKELKKENFNKTILLVEEKEALEVKIHE
jgi:hypothetical protein